MQQADFVLRSGAKLHLSTAPWEVVIALWSAVNMSSIKTDDVMKKGLTLISSAEVQRCIKDLFPWATYDAIVMYPGIFDELKMGEQVRGDYLELSEKIMDFQLRPFFLMTSSKSTTSNETPTSAPKQP